MSLAQQLEEVSRDAGDLIPADDLGVIVKGLQGIVGSGIERGALKVGDRVPDFELPGADGGSVRLADLLEKGPVVVAFYRGHWCPYCNVALHALQQALPQFREAGARLVAISPETPDNSMTLIERQKLEYDVLSDAENRVARVFGLVFELPESVRPVYDRLGISLPAFNGDESFELPVPATYVINRDGRIRWSHVDADYTKRAEPAQILAALKQVRDGN